MAESRDPKELADLWTGWRRIAPPMRARYTRFVELTNKGARELGFDDTGAMWRSNYDMPPDQFSAEVERLWQQVRPFYVSLHAYVRRRLAERYGAAVVPPDGPIPAHLLGNPWAQEWGNIYDLVAPPGESAGTTSPSGCARSKMDARAIVRTGEGFFTSLGFAPLPADVLGALALHQARRSRRRLPRQRVVDRQPRRRAPEDVHPGERGGLQHRAPRARAQLLPARVPAAAVPVHEQRERRVPRGHRRHHRALDHAGVPEADRPHRRRAAGDGRHRPAAAPGARQDRVPAVRAADRSVALARVLRRDHAGATTTRRGGTCGRGTRAWPRRSRAARRTSIPARSTTCRRTTRTRATSSRASCSSSFTARCARPPGSAGRCTAVRSTAARRPASACSACWRWARAARGPRRWRRSPGQRQMDATAIVDYFAPLKAWLDEQNRGHAVGW